MWQRTFSSLGQVVRWRKPRPSGGTVEDAERRVWVRYPCDLEATCQAANPPDSMRLSARVRDISRGGIQLVLNCLVDTGSLLSIELPGGSAEATSTVLAYVVRVNAADDGEWQVGCTFATQLEDADLEPLGAKRQKPTARDQRAYVRFPCSVQASYQLVKAPDPDPRPIRVVNISATGIGLQTDHPIDLGRLLSLELRGVSGSFVLSILACVVRLDAQAGGQWFQGCNLIRELTEPELKALLEQPQLVG
jgi:PilZ domain-containing protein